MNTKMMIAIISVTAVVAVSAAVLFVITGDGDNEDTSAESGYNATVWLDDGTEETEFAGNGESIRKIIENALYGHDVRFNSNGNITSVDGKENTGTKVWTIFKWASPKGWAVFSDRPSGYVDGMSIAVRYADRTADDKGNVSYSPPDIDVNYKVYFFIQLREQYNSTVWMQKLNLSDAEKQAGVWIEGTGSTANEALADAVLTYMFADYAYTNTDAGDRMIYAVGGEEGLFTYGMRPDMYGWFLSFFGWSDTKVSSDGSEYGTWTYWSQYTYHPDAKSLNDPKQWGYNQFAFGMHDITKYRYFGLILQTTSAEDDVDAVLPSPSDMPKGL